MNNLNKAIYQTLSYFDIFEYPLTLLEIKKWLWRYKEEDINKIKLALDEITEINQVKGFYCLKGREKNIETRLYRYRLAEQKIKRAKKYITLLSLMPQVRGIFLCNNLAFHNSRKESDIDLFITTVPGKIWTARLFTTALVKILGLRPSERRTEDTICLSFFAVEGRLNLEKLKVHPQRDIYLTYWVDQLLPLYTTKQAYYKLRRANTWIKKYLPNSYGYKLAFAPRVIKTPGRRWIKKTLEKIPGENLYKQIQLKILPEKLKELKNKDSRVVVTDKMLKFHGTDNREKYQAEWLTRIKKIDSI